MRIALLLMTVGLLLAGCLDKVDPISNINSAAQSGMVTLIWEPPTQNADGTPLMDLAGYNIYIGKSSNSYDRKIRLGNPGLTAFVVDDLDAGTYYFAATAFNSSGVESRFSGEIIRTLN